MKTTTAPETSDRLARPTAQLSAQIALLAGNRFARREAAARLDARMPASRYALRHALLCDRDGNVRAAAAEQLGRPSRVELTPAARDQLRGFLCDALDDASQLVREEALRSLGRLGRATELAAREAESGGAAEVQALVSRSARFDPIWRVRRAAGLALAVLAERSAIPTLLSMLDDPFWRVRHAAVQALITLGKSDADARAQMVAPVQGLSEVASAARWFLRAQLDPEVSIHKFTPPARKDSSLWNADPAVTTARLRAQPLAELDPLTLVPMLADPHEPLRTLAAQRLRERGSLPSLRAALQFLETPAIPHAAETVAALLDGLGTRAQKLAAEVLADRDALPGAIAWAAEWVVATRSTEHYDAIRSHAHSPRPRTRFAVASALAQLATGQPRDVAILTALLDDEDEAVRTTAALSFYPLAAQDATVREALALREAWIPHPAVRSARIDVAAQLGELAQLHAAAADLREHPLPRSRALAALVRLRALADAERFLSEDDPWIRAAVLRAAPPDWLLRIVTSDPDARLRRLALKRALARRRHLSDAARAELAHAACTAPDPWLRAEGAALLDLVHDADLRTALALLRDDDPGVRAAAAAVLDALPDSVADARLRALLAAAAEPLAESARAAAYSLLLRSRDERAAELLAQALNDPAETAGVRAELQAQALLVPDRFHAVHPQIARAAAELLQADAVPPRTKPAPPRPGLRRLLGRTGIEVSPLGISGANDLPESALEAAHQAGVNLFFTCAAR